MVKISELKIDQKLWFIGSTSHPWKNKYYPCDYNVLSVNKNERSVAFRNVCYCCYDIENLFYTKKEALEAYRQYAEDQSEKYSKIAMEITTELIDSVVD